MKSLWRLVLTALFAGLGLGIGINLKVFSDNNILFQWGNENKGEIRVNEKQASQPPSNAGPVETTRPDPNPPQDTSTNSKPENSVSENLNENVQEEVEDLPPTQPVKLRNNSRPNSLVNYRPAVESEYNVEDDSESSEIYCPRRVQVVTEYDEEEIIIVVDHEPPL